MTSNEGTGLQTAEGKTAEETAHRCSHHYGRNMKFRRNTSNVTVKIHVTADENPYSAIRATDSSLPFSSLSPFLMVTYRTFFFASSARLFGWVGTS